MPKVFLLHKRLYVSSRISSQMAKKKRRIKEEPKESYEFTPTEFDEREFILKELFETKVFFVVILFSLLAGVQWAIFYRLGNYLWIIGFLVCILLIVKMKDILRLLGIRMEMMAGKSMAGNYIMFMLLATGLAILLINAPFY
jgi:hypothetical protein